MTESGKSRRVRSQAPYPLAMVVCDAIWTDPTTGKKTILGCFSAIHARQFPAPHPLLALYIALTDGHGKVHFKVRLVDADEEMDPLFEGEGDALFPDPRMVLEMEFHLTNVVFPKPGEYRLQLFAATELLMERRIVVFGAEEVQDEPNEA